LHEVINDGEDDRIYLIMDYAEKGELIEWDEEKARFFFRDTSMKEKFLEEGQVRDLAMEIIKGLAYRKVIK